jgi:hypothetical protein
MALKDPLTPRLLASAEPALLPSSWQSIRTYQR